MKYAIDLDEYYGPDAELVPDDHPCPGRVFELTDEEHAKVQQFKRIRWEVEQMLCKKLGIGTVNYPP